jgi:four helix bundle protein
MNRPMELENDNPKEERKYDLEDRLVDYSILISTVVEQFYNTKLGNHIGGQLTRSSSSPALNYGEAQSAESRSDFIHKMKVCLKEIRESRVCLKIAIRKPLCSDLSLMQKAFNETNELASIFNKSIATAEKNKTLKI